MSKIIKIAFIAYFAVLLGILWTYISYSDTSVDLRMNIASTLATDPEHPTAFAVWAYEKDKNYDFSQWTLVTVLIPTSATQTRSCTTAFAVDDSDPYSKHYFVTHDIRDVYTHIARFNDFPNDHDLFFYDKPFLRNLYRSLKDDHAVVTHLSSEGRVMISIPSTVFHDTQLLKESSAEPYTACFLLIDPEFNLRKEVSFELNPVQEAIHIPSMRSVTWIEPNPLLLNEKGELLIDVNGFALENHLMEEAVIHVNNNEGADSTSAGTPASADAPEHAPEPIPNDSHFERTHLTTKVNFGRIGIASEIPVSSIGLARASITVETPSDLQFDYASTPFYGSFTPNDRPLRLEVPNPVIVPGEPFSLYIKTIIGDNDVYLDYYYYNHWMGRSITRTDSIHPITISHPPEFDISAPEVIILSGCLSSWDCKETAQRVAIIASPKPISLRVQTEFALKTYYESSFENEKNKEAAGILYRRVLTNPKLSEVELTLARDYALARIATGIPAVEPSIVARTETVDKEAKLKAKENHHAIANPLFILFISVGIFVFVVAAIRSRIGRENYNFDDAPEQQTLEQKSDTIKRYLLYVILFALGIGVAIGLYDMMQII